MSDPTFKVSVVRGRVGLQSIAGEWDSLTAGRNELKPWHLRPWHEAYIETLFDDPNAIAFAVVHSQNRMIANLPLHQSVTRFMGIRASRVQLPYHEHLPYSDMILADGFDPPTILAVLLKGLPEQAGLKWDAITLPRVVDDSFARRAIDQSHRAYPGGVHVAGGNDTMRVMPYDERLKLLSKNFRGNLRKARNKLESASGVSFQTDQTAEDVQRGLEAFFAVEASGWKGRAGQSSAIGIHPKLRAYYERLMAGFARIGAAEIHRLSVEGRTIAAQVCVVCGDTLCILKIGYDESHASFAPGNMLLERVLQQAADRGLATINLMSDAAWHDDWKCDRHAVHSIQLFNRTFAGRLLRMGRAMSPLQAAAGRADRSVRNLLRPAWRRLKPRDT